MLRSAFLVPISVGLVVALFGCSSDPGGSGTPSTGGSAVTSGGALGGGGASGATAVSGGSSGTAATSGGASSGGALGSPGTGGSAQAGAVGNGGTTQGGRPGMNGGAPNASGGTSPGGGGAMSMAGRSGGGGPGNGGTNGGSAGATTMGGAGGGSGTGNTGGSTGGQHAICNFASGLNVAWVNFARDVPNPDMATFQTIFKNTHDAGGRVIRWWFHTNGSTTPGYDSSGLTQKLPQSHIDGVKAILNAANMNGVSIVLSLWSFDMLQDNAGTAYMNNKLLLENDTNRQAYIDNYLTPLVVALKGTPGLYSYEIFNEPEGMGPKGWATYRTTTEAIQKTVNWLSAAIHTADPTALVTNGAQTFDYCSNVSGKTNYYSDSALRQIGGKQNGTLDYYEVHYYTQNGASNSPFTKKASDWGLDKKLVMGEFFAEDTDGVGKDDLYTYLYSNGYQGGWAWSYNADEKWPTMQAPMQALYTAHPDVGDCR